MKAGGPQMQIADVPPELLGVVQALIVLLIAAPPLVRAIFRLPSPSAPTAGSRRTRRAAKKGGVK
jgi:simple sugar transport system permease protein